MEYYSSIEKNEIISFAAAWMGLENIIFSEISQTEKEISYDIVHIQNLKKYDNELIYKTETDSQPQRANLWLSGKEGRVREVRTDM